MTKRVLCLLFMVVTSVMWCGRLKTAQSSSDKPAQGETTARCSGPAYKAGDVSRKAKIIDYPQPAGEPEGEGEWKEKGRVVLRAILCRSGEVTDIEVIEGLPDGLTEKAVAAAKQIKFRPAERRRQKVSQRAIFEYTFRVRD